MEPVWSPITDNDGAIFAASAGSSTSVAPLTDADVAAVLPAAVRQWIGAGASARVLAGMTIVIGDLPGNKLADTLGSTITIDADAAGWGWNLTPGVTDGTRIDLLSVLLHEIGHVLGYEHTTGGLMAEAIEPGTQLGIETSTAVQSTADGTVLDAAGATASAATAGDIAAVAVEPLTALVSSPAVDLVAGVLSRVVHLNAPRTDLDPMVTSARSPLSGPLDWPLASAMSMLVTAFSALLLLRRRRAV